MNRRSLIASAIGGPALFGAAKASAQESEAQFQYPIGWAGEIAGDGFVVRHGYACENTWYNPGYWHTGEDWYAIEGETAGAEVVSIAAGEVVFAGSEYPGRVVIIQHDTDLFSMYGHLDHVLATGVGDTVGIGQRLGTVLLRTDGAAPSHLHFEVRTFLITPEVNGNQPRYGFACGFDCPPGPGYWPIDAPEHPTSMGWRNPTHVIARGMFADSNPPAGFEVVVPAGASERAPIWSLPSDRANAVQIGEIDLSEGDRFPVTDVATGPELEEGTSAEAYRLWYEIDLADGPAWVEGMVASDIETGSDGRPSALVLIFAPDVTETWNDGLLSDSERTGSDPIVTFHWRPQTMMPAPKRPVAGSHSDSLSIKTPEAGHRGRI